ncbi:MAG TPA: peptidase, partial [Cystobacter sp.]
MERFEKVGGPDIRLLAVQPGEGEMFNRRLHHAAFLALGMLSTACGEQEGATQRIQAPASDEMSEHEHELENDAMYKSQYPKGHAFQVRLAGLKAPVTAVLKGN